MCYSLVFPTISLRGVKGHGSDITGGGSRPGNRGYTQYMYTHVQSFPQEANVFVTTESVDCVFWNFGSNATE